MIPLRIELAGFLSYKGNQELEFASSSLWMLAGANGSGKSAIFDAVTYALFGQHRGGSQNHVELINKESNSCSVEFDFRLEEKTFRLKRTLRRSKTGVQSTQQISRLDDEGQWTPIPETGKKTAFDEWIRTHIGFSFDVFTSSVLLLQGKAEKLLDSTPSGRSTILAGVVDLARYQRLYTRANDLKLELKSRVEALAHQSEAIPEVPDESLAAAERIVVDCDHARGECRRRIDELGEWEAKARSWAEAMEKLDKVRQRLASAELLLASAVKIEASHARFLELNAVLPAANDVVSMRGRFGDSERATAKYNHERIANQERKTSAEHELEQAKQKRDSLKKQLDADEKRKQSIETRLRELGALLEKVRLVEEQRTEVERLSSDLKAFPADIEAKASEAKHQVDELEKLTRVIPSMERFRAERLELIAVFERESATRKELERIKNEGEKAKLEDEKLKAEGERVRTRRETAERESGAAAALEAETRRAADEFASLDGAKSCKSCGQTLTKKHFAEEKKRRLEAIRTAEERRAAADKERLAALEEETSWSSRASVIKGTLDRLRDDYREAQSTAKQAEADVKRLRESLALRHSEMPEPFRSRIASGSAIDWTQTLYPEAARLDELKREAAGLEAAKRRMAELDTKRTSRGHLQVRLETAQGALSRLEVTLPQGASPESLRSEHSEKKTEEGVLAESVKSGKKVIGELDLAIDKLGRDAHEAVRRLTEITGLLAREDANRAHCQETIDRAMKGLPEPWKPLVDKAGMSDYQKWKTEQDDLIGDHVEEKFKKLESARASLTTIREEKNSLELLVDSFPEESRRPPEMVRELIEEARLQEDAKEKELREAERHRSVLLGHREQREKYGKERLATEGAFQRYKTLAELLGRDRLQRHLLRRAERRIVDYANGVLDRLSGGQLFLKLVTSDDGTAADRALEMEAFNRATGGPPINVAFLSGSQRFRVAVSLALAIGQYAGKSHRPIESVIIDEGFGCLDRQGRQVMIQELHNLRGHLRCILLVSHQEEFSEAFADGYRFELIDGATRVSRFRR